MKNVGGAPSASSPAPELGMKTGQGFLPRSEETADASRTWLADHPIDALTGKKAPPDTATMT